MHYFRQYSTAMVNSFRPRQNKHSFADNRFKCIFLKENVLISILKKSQKFIPKGPINNIPVVVQLMFCRLVGANYDYLTDVSSGLNELR